MEQETTVVYNSAPETLMLPGLNNIYHKIK